MSCAVLCLLFYVNILIMNYDYESDISLDEFYDSNEDDSNEDDSNEDDSNEVVANEVVANEVSFNWSKIFVNENKKTIGNYNGNCNIEDEMKLPIDAFKKFFDTEIFELITLETNYYGRLKYEKANKNWIPVTYEQIQSFIGILIFMVFHKLPKINDYWSNDITMYTPFVRKAMTKDMFWTLWTTIHLNKNDEDDHTDKFFKVRKLTDALRIRFQNHWTLG